ncbi:hypothetical protein MSPP1_004151 [Malassezia sp. CBS 17886]|nr:hypothetical protein MSPP1_004151 [Malassezia sp. CBS 17886]
MAPGARPVDTYEGHAPVPALDMPPALRRGMPLLDPAQHAHFDVDAFLCSRVRGQDVAHVLHDLRAYSGTLQQALVQVINDKYRDFVGLATLLAGDASSVRAVADVSTAAAMRASLAAMRDELRAVDGEVVRLQQAARLDAAERRQLNAILETEQVLSQLQGDVDRARRGHSRGCSALSGAARQGSHGAAHARDDAASPPASPAAASPFARVASAAAGDMPAAHDDDARDLRAAVRAVDDAVARPRSKGPAAAAHPEWEPSAERVARTLQAYTWMQFHLLASIDSTTHAAFLAAIAPRIRTVQDALGSDALALLREALRSEAHTPSTCASPPGASALFVALQTCLALDRDGPPTCTREALAVLRDDLVAPCVAAWVGTNAPLPELPVGLHPRLYDDTDEVRELEAMTHLALGPPADAVDAARIVRLYNGVLAVGVRTAHVAAVAEKVGGAFLDVYNDVAWHLAATALMDKHGAHLFFVGRPYEFHRSHTLGCAMLAAWEALAPSARAAAAFRAHPKRRAWDRRWQLSAFFHMHVRARVQALERVLAGERAGGSNAGDEPRVAHTATPLFSHPAFSHLLTAFLAPWRAVQHIPTLAAREWRFSLHVLSRYRTWLAHALAESAVNRSDTSLSAGIARLHAKTAILADVDAFERGGGTAPGPAETTAAKRLAPRSAPPSTALLAACRSALDDSLGAFPAHLPAVADDVQMTLRDLCAAPLSQVRAGSQYGALARADTAVSAPSAYVSEILRPLRAFLGETATGVWDPDALGRLDKALVTAWAMDVVDATVRRYTNAVDTVARNLESLRRLKRGTPGLADASDADRSVYAQLHTDVEALAADVDETGTCSGLRLSHDTGAWIELRARVARREVVSGTLADGGLGGA